MYSCENVEKRQDTQNSDVTCEKRESNPRNKPVDALTQITP